MATKGPLSVRLEFSSAFEMLDFVEVVSDHICKDIGLDDDAIHWVSVAVRESVANAIKHGNQNDAGKKVFVAFDGAFDGIPELCILVRDQGDGFDPGDVADPLAPENILKGSGRGIFLMRNFMDEVVLRRVPEGGMEVRMVKRLLPAGTRDLSA
ncbi:MAG: ATP-binding protein [Vicinamibacterales bacterium]